jgi:uncharacterized protein YecT (DUF1311 family)
MAGKAEPGSTRPAAVAAPAQHPGQAVPVSQGPAVKPASYAKFKLTAAEQEQREGKAFVACMEKSGGVTVNMRDCSEAEGKRLDALLNSTYQSALARLPSDAAREQLRAQQRRWLETRYDHCDQELEEAGEGGPHRGTMALLILDDCGLSEDQRRIAWLERYR